MKKFGIIPNVKSDTLVQNVLKLVVSELNQKKKRNQNDEQLRL